MTIIHQYLASFAFSTKTRHCAAFDLKKCNSQHWIVLGKIFFLGHIEVILSVNFFEYLSSLFQ